MKKKVVEEILEEAKERRQQTENDMWPELEEYIASEDSEKMMAQSSNKKAENLENDFTEIAAAIREMGLG